MNKQEAIKYLEQHRHSNPCGRKVLEESNEAIDMAIQALSAERTGEWKVRLLKEDKTLWVKVDSTETLDSFSRVVIKDRGHWCKVFYEDGR